MKTTLLAALIACMSLNGNAQNKDYSCKQKTTYHHTTHKESVVSNAQSSSLDAKKQAAACYTKSYSHVMESSFTGNYPRSIDINETKPAKSLTVTSPAFKNLGALPAKYTCEGGNASPPLTVKNIPTETQSLAIIMYDPNATEKTSETYWLIWDIDTTGIIPENFVNDHESINDAKEYGYHAACPLSGTHYYHFMVYALDTKFAGNRHTTREKLESTMRGHILAKGELIGVYDRL